MINAVLEAMINDISLREALDHKSIQTLVHANPTLAIFAEINLYRIPNLSTPLELKIVAVNVLFEHHVECPSMLFSH